MKWFKRKSKGRTSAKYADPLDPLDPHGDGTLRPGDPVFDAVMRGNAVIGNRSDDGTWDYKEVPDEQR